MPITNPIVSVTVATYIPPSTKRRMIRIRRKNPRLTLSKQILQCLEIALPKLEFRVGLKFQR
jgi:hypothetical protein